MTKQEISINFTLINNTEELYKKLSKLLKLPKHFGHNADALYDVLTGYICLPTKIVFKNITKQQLVQYKNIIDCINDACNETDNELQFVIIEN